MKLQTNEFTSKMQHLDNVIAKLSQERRPRHAGGSSRTHGAILLVSQAKNACISLSALDEDSDDGGEPDLHQCGHCKFMFNSMTKYISHKLQRTCRHEKNRDSEEVGWTSRRIDVSSPDGSTRDDVDDELKNGEHDIQKRKMRKGYVRRVKPIEEVDSGVGGVYEEDGSNGYEGESSQNYQGTQLGELEKENFNENSGGSKGQEDRFDFTKQSFLQKVSKGETASKVRGYSNYMSSSGKKPYVMHARSADNHIQNAAVKRVADQSKNKHTYNELVDPTRVAFPYRFPNPNTSGRIDRVPSNLPQIMSIRGSTRHLETSNSRRPSRHPYHSERTLQDGRYPSPNTRSHSATEQRSRSYPSDKTCIDGSSTLERQYLENLHPKERSRSTKQYLPQEKQHSSENPPSGERKYVGDNRYPHGNYEKYDDDDSGRGYSEQSVEADTVPVSSRSPYDSVQTSMPQNRLLTTQNPSEHNTGEGSQLNETNEAPKLDQQQGNEQVITPAPKCVDQGAEDIPSENPTEMGDLRGKLNQGDGQVGLEETMPLPATFNAELVKLENPDRNKLPPVLQEHAPQLDDGAATMLYDQRETHLLSPLGDRPGGVTNVHESEDPETSPLGGDTAFMDLSSPEKDSNSPHDSNHGNEIEDYNMDNPRQTSEDPPLPPRHTLSESMVERLITVPVSGGADASWKHAKQMYSCPLCAKVFPFKSKLQRHVLVHTGIKPYKCTVCGRGFTQQIDLQRHLTRHTGEKPFKCHLCTAQFIRADNLKKHCKDSHYINIEEPIRKRRRKTTGSDTVLPSLEVAIALAFSETERNGGRVLGRAATRAAQSNTMAEGGVQGNYNLQDQLSGDAPVHGGRYTGSFPSMQTARPPYPGKMEGSHPGFMGGRFAAKPPGRFHYKFETKHNMNNPHYEDIGASNENSRMYATSYMQGNNNTNSMMSRSEDSNNLYPPTLTETSLGDQNVSRDQLPMYQTYLPGYRPLPSENRDQGYLPLRSEDEDFNRSPAHIDYQIPVVTSNQPNTESRHGERFDTYCNIPRTVSENTGNHSLTGNLIMTCKREEQELIDANLMYSQMTHVQSASLSSSTSTLVRSVGNQDGRHSVHQAESAFNYADCGSLSLSRPTETTQQHGITRQSSDTQSDTLHIPRPPFGFEQNYRLNDNADGDGIDRSGDVVGETDTEIDEGSTSEEVKPDANDDFDYLQTARIDRLQNNVYVGEEEIPIVTRSDDIATIAEDM